MLKCRWIYISRLFSYFDHKHFLFFFLQYLDILISYCENWLTKVYTRVFNCVLTEMLIVSYFIFLGIIFIRKWSLPVAQLLLNWCQRASGVAFFFDAYSDLRNWGGTVEQPISSQLTLLRLNIYHPGTGWRSQ